jgi:hypothetical protein
MTYTSPWRAHLARAAEFPTALRTAAGSTTVTVVRVRYQLDQAGRGYHQVRAFAADYHQVWLSPEQVGAVLELLLARRPDIDWTRAHDYHLDTGMLRAAPAADERGGIPEGDRTFGGSDPVFLPVALPSPASSAAAA